LPAVGGPLERRLRPWEAELAAVTFRPPPNSGHHGPSPALVSVCPCSSRPRPSIPHLTRAPCCAHRQHHRRPELQPLTGRLAASDSRRGTLMPLGGPRRQAEGPPPVLDISASTERHMCTGDRAACCPSLSSTPTTTPATTICICPW
jgi:hypothetical protein